MTTASPSSSRTNPSNPLSSLSQTDLHDISVRWLCFLLTCNPITPPSTSPVVVFVYPDLPPKMFSHTPLRSGRGLPHLSSFNFSVTSLEDFPRLCHLKQHSYIFSFFLFSLCLLQSTFHILELVSCIISLLASYQTGNSMRASFQFMGPGPQLGNQ